MLTPYHQERKVTFVHKSYLMKRQIRAILILLFVVLQMFAQTDKHMQQRGAELSRCTEYKQVANKVLNDDELFVMFYMDAALVVDPNADIQIVKQIKTENPWESLKEYLYNKSNIYFCPSGSQLGVAIEYMPCPDDANVIMSDRYGMYRLSSPEELFKNRGEAFRNSKHKAVVFGGWDYDGMSDDAEMLLAFRGKRSAEGYGKLKNAYEEAIYIDSLLRRKGIEVALLNGEQGSERSFYELPSSKADILHIASHGEYMPNEDNLESHTFEEWMMSHSALILSGYNQFSEDTKNDGRLTAYEISQTDLSNIKLAVLSACETGKGDIKENDVYGLLKGFKMAGAGTLMLSLANVNDEPTSILMKRFYENIFRGDNPRRALENAQMYLRIYLDTYKDGLYKDSLDWKKFILVDDLDRNIGQNITQDEQEYFLNNIVGLRELYAVSQFLPNWDKARKRLKGGDKFVRFFSYLVNENDKQSAQYVAMVGDAKTGGCNFTRLFNIDESNISDYTFDFNRFDYFDSLVWQPILNEIQDCHNLYFQTTGILNNMPIESFSSIIDSYKNYRISSLDALSRKRESIISCGEIALFGGLYYDCADNNDLSTPIEPLTRGIALGLPFLPSTLVEVNAIDSIARESSFHSIKLTGNSGTEVNLREIVKRKNLNALHIATHGYASESTLDFAINSLSEYLFSNTALFLSNAYENINGIDIDNEGEGILTGAEISQLNLQDLDLVTLSLCDANKGIPSNLKMITSDDNWSLVSAFKKAGVNTILGSTTAVEDESTSQLMIEFYRNWLKGKMTLRQSLEKARNTLRNSEKWNEPRYWASFVLLDGLD